MSEKETKTDKVPEISISCNPFQASALVGLIDAGIRAGGLNSLEMAFTAAPVIQNLINAYQTTPEAKAQG